MVGGQEVAIEERSLVGAATDAAPLSRGQRDPKQTATATATAVRLKPADRGAGRYGCGDVNGGRGSCGVIGGGGDDADWTDLAEAGNFWARREISWGIGGGDGISPRGEGTGNARPRDGGGGGAARGAAGIWE